MAIGAQFENRNFPAATYEQTLTRLTAAGAGAPAGRLQHFALEGDSGDIIVFDVWESPEALEAFGATLIPVLTELGVELVPPRITPLYNNITG